MACGWLEMPFWTFLGATVLGKGFTKVTIQCMVCITVTLSLLLTLLLLLLLTLTLTLTLLLTLNPTRCSASYPHLAASTYAALAANPTPPPHPQHVARTAPPRGVTTTPSPTPRAAHSGGAPLYR